MFECIVLDEVGGNRHLVLQVGSSEAFGLAATLGGIAFGHPMTYQFMAALVESLGGRVRQVRIDRVVTGAYAATVEVDGSLGARLVDARPSDALNLAVLVGAASSSPRRFWRTTSVSGRVIRPKQHSCGVPSNCRR